MRKFIVRRIYEPEFGCEGRMDGQVAMANVLLEDEEGERNNMSIEDSLLYKKDIYEGDWVVIDSEGEIFKL